MATVIEVPCFRYAGTDLRARLTIEQGSDGRSLVFCPVRQGYFALRPEEHVRQALIWFLTKGAESAPAWAQQFRLLVERSSLDVSAVHAHEPTKPRFAPNIPVVIFETKRIECDSEDDSATDKQLQGYMIRERCCSGFIFNGRQAAWLSLIGEFTAPTWTKTPISDLAEVEVRINVEAERIAAFAADCKAKFTRAAAGDFDALVALVRLFGTAAGLTFFLSVRSDGQIGPMQGFYLKIVNSELVTFRARSAGGKHRLELTRQSFHALRSIEPVNG